MVHMDDHLGTCRACTSVRFDRGAPSPKWWKPPGPNLPPSEPSSQQSCAMSLISPSPFVPSTCANLWKQGRIQFLPPLLVIHFKVSGGGNKRG